MEKIEFAPDFEDLPDSLPIFPLTGVLLLPTGQLPLNIFEPRYLQMVEDAMASNRLIGMVQPKDQSRDKPGIYAVGCAGKITDFSETPDGRYLISLTGVCRFKIVQELNVTTLYRQAQASWAEFKNDIYQKNCPDVNREKLYELLASYFKKQGLSCDWTMIDEAKSGRLITCLSMICPFDPEEKQALLEAPCCESRAKNFMAMLEMALYGQIEGGKPMQ